MHHSLRIILVSTALAVLVGQPPGISATEQHSLVDTKWGKMVQVEPPIEKPHADAVIGLTGLERMKEYQAAPTTTQMSPTKGYHFIGIHLLVKHKNDSQRAQVDCLTVRLTDDVGQTCECGWEQGSADNPEKVMLLYAVKDGHDVVTATIGQTSFDVKGLSTLLK
ncbi:MAG: hypothetical protein ACYSUI_10315 [Planctomycetota bacterium]|jgi:hypothetical protein